MFTEKLRTEKTKGHLLRRKLEIENVREESCLPLRIARGGRQARDEMIRNQRIRHGFLGVFVIKVQHPRKLLYRRPFHHVQVSQRI